MTVAAVFIVSMDTVGGGAAWGLMPERKRGFQVNKEQENNRGRCDPLSTVVTAGSVQSSTCFSWRVAASWCDLWWCCSVTVSHPCCDQELCWPADLHPRDLPPLLSSNLNCCAHQLVLRLGGQDWSLPHPLCWKTSALPPSQHVDQLDLWFF